MPRGDPGRGNAAPARDLAGRGLGHLEPAPPFLTYTDGVTLWSGGLRCDVRYVGTPAHTTNDSIIHIPERSVVFTGDLLFNGGTPFALMGSVSGWIEVLRSVLRPLGAQTLVPGHGPVCGPEVIDDTLAYLNFVQATARAAKLEGGERGAPADVARALGDMVAYNGGRPLTCHA